MIRVKYGRALGAAAAGAYAFAAASLAALAMPTQPLSTIHTPRAVAGAGVPGGASVTRQLHHIVTIGSTVDPQNGDQNPYGLTIAPSTYGAMTQGDLVVCNFNDSLNIQGLGTTIEILHPTPGSTPTRLVQDQQITGCDAIALDTGDNPWTSDFTANTDMVYDSSGNFVANLSGAPFYEVPWGQAYSGTKGPYGQAAFYESNATDGSITRINITQKGFRAQVIATGFSVNHGFPGTALAPSGLTYDAAHDTLYIVDGNVNEVVAFHDASLIPAHGIAVNGFTYNGVAAPLAETVFHGTPLSAPISAAELYNGNLVVGNTFNNELVEINPTTKAVVHMVNLDKHAIGALFGIAATGTSASNTQIFFNDDNLNAVEVLQQ